MSPAAGNTIAPSGRRRGDRRAAARLAAVQALYQLEMNAADVEDLILEFLAHRLGNGEGGYKVETQLFSDVVRGVASRAGEIDRLLVPALSPSWPIDRLESVLRALLRCGVYELRWRPDVPARVVINEYVEVAKVFFDGGEPGFANGVLDRLARQLRAGEMTDVGRGGGAGAG